MKFKKFLTLLLVFSIIISCLTFFEFGFNAASSSSSLLEQYNQLEKEQQELLNKLDSIKNERNDQSDYVTTLQKQIDTTQEQIDILNERLDELNNDVYKLNLENETLQREIDQKQLDINDNWENFKSRLRAMYMSGNISSLELLLSADSLSDFLSRTEMLQSVTEHDTELINTLKDDITSLEDSKAMVETNIAALQSTQAEIETSKIEFDAKQTDLTDQWQEQTELVASLNQDESAYQQTLLEQQQELETINKELLEVYGIERPVIQLPAEYTDSGSFIWPLPGFSLITSGYGPRWGTTHNGLDISGPNAYGTSIIASRSGVVIYVRYSATASYGKYLIIDHGDGYSTLYAHCSSILVSEGQTVAQGSVIAKVGSTGFSTGPHLHFEIRINNGTAVNPLNYVSP